MKLNDLLSSHKLKFREKLIEVLAKKNALNPEQVEAEYNDFIEQYIEDKYEQVEILIDRINKTERPVLLNIRRDKDVEDKCKICEANQPNVDEIAEKYGDSIEVIEASETKPDGGGLYHIIYHEDADEKKVPLTAVINRGEILKFWAGKTVDAVVYERFIKKIPSQE